MTVQTVVGYYDSNTFVVEDNGTVLVIDAGAKLKDVQTALGSKKPSAVLLTHEHYDHVYYLDDYKAAFNCPVYTPTDEKEIVIGGITVKPMLCPGHSPNSVVYLVGDNLFTGDVLFADTIGRTDLNGGFRPSKATLEVRAQNKAQMQAALKRLLGVKFKTAYHGHYGSSSFEEQQENIKSFIKD